MGTPVEPDVNITYRGFVLITLFFTAFNAPISFFKLNNDINSAYDVLSNSMKEKYVSLDNFRMYINNNLNRITTDADKCSLESVKNKRIYTVLDKNSNKYVFVETNIMNYKVDFYLYDNSVENK